MQHFVTQSFRIHRYEASPKYLSVLWLPGQRGRGLHQQLAGGGEDGGDHLQHLGHQVQDTGAPHLPAPSSRPGIVVDTEVRMIELISNIWGTKFKIQGLHTSLPPLLGQV
jgi:hypothetical protein